MRGRPLDLRWHTLYPVRQSGELIRASRPPGLQFGPSLACSRRFLTDGDPPGVSSGHAFRSSATIRGMPGEVAVEPPDGIDLLLAFLVA